MSVLNQGLRILHWNCNGFDSAKKSDIFSFLSENSIDILSLNENHQSRPNISSFRKLYHQQSKVDLIVYIRQNISFRIIHKSTSSEFDFTVIAIMTNLPLFFATSYMEMRSLVYQNFMKLSCSSVLFTLSASAISRIPSLPNDSSEKTNSFILEFFFNISRFIPTHAIHKKKHFPSNRRFSTGTCSINYSLEAGNFNTL
jgi:hypothetical protein